MSFAGTSIQFGILPGPFIKNTCEPPRSAHRMAGSEWQRTKFEADGAGTMRIGLRVWGFAVTVAVSALVSAAAAQTTTKNVGEAPGIIPSAFGEAVDRDIMTIRA